MLYPEWTAPVMPAWVTKAPKGIKNIVASRFSHHRGKVEMCERDGLPQIAPIVAVAERTPTELRKELGKAVWKQIHHASVSTNSRRAYIWIHDLGRTPFAEIIQYRPCHLQRLVNAKPPFLEHQVYAAKFAPVGLFSEIASMHRDTQRMGITVNPAWSLSRLKREHDAAALKGALAKSSPKEWAAPARYELSGLLFTRLVSDRDLSAEGLMQRHCVASYAREAKKGDLQVYSISGEERATLAFWRDGRICDLKGFANSQPSARMKRAAKAFIAEIITTDGRP
ncbi:PcfJ domain-containing protein [Salipiger abyssi]|uniref:PcfJ domain-containing protein n=1 Tax=Salipiger abyssi TaxID=1250539 RepID=UPI0009784CEB|nr:PcfJ domain-containing protein [Salipiger abyssi]